jgi:hypothetical protein
MMKRTWDRLPQLSKCLDPLLRPALTADHRTFYRTGQNRRVLAIRMLPFPPAAVFSELTSNRIGTLDYEIQGGVLAPTLNVHPSSSRFGPIDLRSER